MIVMEMEMGGRSGCRLGTGGLQSSSVTPNVVVAADGSGNFKTVAAAVAAAPEGSSKSWSIEAPSSCSPSWCRSLCFLPSDMLAYQDTLYVHSNRQYYINCLVAGTVDFIFGNAAAVLQDCDIHARKPNSGQKNMLTAQGRTDANQNTGIVIQNRGSEPLLTCKQSRVASRLI
ncbi:hypothetical protein LWI29_017885 [Acer saccharum]|uniref:Pectinesterase n=1 Tax=Acer saccharum TaxID=4024 RepID=A0AA39VZC8_ACESA|nr:hypothetical protein LWI29_017885 [Acer saccharum]